MVPPICSRNTTLMSETRILKMRGGGIIKYLKNESILKCHTRNMKCLRSLEDKNLIFEKFSLEEAMPSL